MNTTIHYIRTQSAFNDLVFKRRLTTGGLYVVIIDSETHLASLYFALNNQDYVTLGSGSSGGGGVYNSSILSLEKLGGLLKGSDLSNITYSDLFNKILYPNYDNEFPNKSVYLGFSEEYPTITIINNLTKIDDYSSFDYHELTTEGYIIVALPATWYLKRIEDSNGINIVNAFELIYKSIEVNNEPDIYNVYVTPKLKYNSELELTFTTKIGPPVQVILTSGTFEINHIKPIITALTITEGLKAIVNSLSISTVFVETLLTSISIEALNVEAIINEVIGENANLPAILNSMTILKGIYAEIWGLSIEKGGDTLLTDITVSTGIKAILNNITTNNWN